MAVVVAGEISKIARTRMLCDTQDAKRGGVLNLLSINLHPANHCKSNIETVL